MYHYIFYEYRFSRYYNLKCHDARYVVIGSKQSECIDFKQTIWWDYFQNINFSAMLLINTQLELQLRIMYV